MPAWVSGNATMKSIATVWNGTAGDVIGRRIPFHQVLMRRIHHRGTSQPSPKPFYSLYLRRLFEVSRRRIGVHLDLKTVVEDDPE